MINLNHLKYFYDVCQSESFTESAKKNFISHSAISQAIKSIESYYGVELMVHKKNSFELTEEGRVLLESIQTIFDSINLSKIKLDNMNKVIAGPLKIGFSYSMAMSFIPGILKVFTKKYPLIVPTIRLANSATLVELILNRELDIGIGIDDTSFLKLQSKTIKKGKFVLVSSKTEINLETETFFIGDKGQEVINFKQFYQKNRLKNQIIEIESWEVISRFIQNNMGVGLIPEYIVDSPLGTRLYIVDLGVKLPQYELKCFYRDEQYLTRNSQIFLNQL